MPDPWMNDPAVIEADELLALATGAETEAQAAYYRAQVTYRLAGNARQARADERNQAIRDAKQRHFAQNAVKVRVTIVPYMKRKEETVELMAVDTGHGVWRETTEDRGRFNSFWACHDRSDPNIKGTFRGHRIRKIEVVND